MSPAWVDHIPPVKPPLSVEEDRRRFWIRECRRQAESTTIYEGGAFTPLALATADLFRRGLRARLEVLGRVLMRQMGCPHPAEEPSPYNPSGLILKGGGAGPFADTATTPTYPERP